MDTGNIPPAILQQLLAQLQGLQNQAQPESDEEEDPNSEEIKQITALTESSEDKTLAEFMSSETPNLQSFKNLSYGELFLCFAIKAVNPDLASQLLQMIYEGKELDQGVCGKKLYSGMVGYSCLDCQMDPTCIICKECFENGDHTGHRFQIKQHVSGMCDCGDPDAWKAEGNCINHNGFIKEDEFMPKEMKKNFIFAFKRAIYYLVLGFELNRGKNMRKKYSKDFLSFIEMCSGLKEEYPTLACLMGRAFCEKFGEGEENNEISLYHNCKDLSGEHPEDPKSQVCNCTVVKALMRYIIWMDSRTQKDLTKFLMGLFVHEEFKMHLAVEYLRLINFNINWERIGKREDDQKAISKMSDMCIQLLTSEHLADLAIEKATMRPFFEGLIRIAQNYKASNGYLYFDDLFYNKINLNIKYVLMKKSGLVRTLLDRESTKLYFLFLEEVNKRKVRLEYDPENADLSIEDNINSILFFEINTVRHWIEMFSNLVSHNPSETEEALFAFLDEAKESIFRMQAYEDENYLNKENDEKIHPRSYSVPLHRIFIVVLVGFVFFEIQDGKINVIEFKEERLKRLFDKIFKNEREKNRFWLIMTQSFSGALGFNREMNNSLWGFYGPIKERFKWLYYNFRIHNFDLVGLQFCNYILKENFANIAFESFFNTPIRNKILKGDFTSVYNSFDKEKESDRQRGAFTTYTDFFRYLNEILQNEINISFIIELYLEEIKDLFKCLPINSKSTKGMTQGKIDFLFSSLTGSPPKEASAFFKSIEKYTQDKTAIAEFMQNYGNINRQKQTVQIERTTLQKEVKKILKTQAALKEEFDEDSEIVLTARPNCELLWYDPNTRGEIYNEIREKMTLEAKKLKGKVKENYHPHELFYSKTYTDFLSILKSRAILNEKFIIKAFSNLIEFGENYVDENEEKTKVGEGSIMSLMEGMITPLYLQTVIILDNFNNSKTSELNSAKKILEKANEFINTFSTHFKENYNFSDFKKIIKFFSFKYLEHSGNTNINNQEGETDIHETLEKEKAKRAKLLAKRKKKLKNKFSTKNKKFMEKLITAADGVVEQIHKENNETNLTCVADNSVISKDDVYYILSQFKTSNVFEWAKVQTINELLKDQTLQSDEKEFEELMSVKEHLLSKIHMEEYFVFNSCKHHIKPENIDKIAEKSRIYKLEELQCPLCKNPSNCVIPVFPGIDAVISALDTPDSKLIKENPEEFNYKETPNSQKMLEFYKKHENEIDTFVNKFFIAYTYYCDLTRSCSLRVKEDIRRPEKKIEEFDVNRSLADSFGYICSLSSLIGLAKIIKDRLYNYNMLYKSLRLNIMKEGLLEGFKNDHLKNIKEYNKNFEAKLERVLTFEDEFMNCDVSELAFECFRNLILSIYDENALSAIFKEKIKFFFELKKSQISHFEEKYWKGEISSSQRISKIQNFAHKLVIYYLIMENSKLGEEKKTLIERLVKESLTGDENEINTLFEILGVEWENGELSLREFKEKNEVEEKMVIEEDNETEIKNEEEKSIFEEQEPLNTKVNGMEEKEKKVPKFTFRFFQSKYDKQLGFSLFDLPESFDSFYKTYLTSNCELCKGRANKNDFAVCLICGTLQCIHACKGKENPRGKPGNLCIHNMQIHAGIGAYLNVMRGSFYYYDNDRLYEFSGLYVDDYGMTLKDFGYRTCDMDTIQLMKDKVGEVRMALLEADLHKRIVQKATLDNKIFNFGYY